MTTMIGPNTDIAFLRARAAQMGSNTRMDTLHTKTKNPDESRIDPKVMRRIEESARDFEAVFLTEMIKPMFEGLEVDETFGGGKGEEVFQDMMIEQYGKKMSEAGGIGLASIVRDELIRQQQGKVE
jgi:Rod binding domain-containing protein